MTRYERKSFFAVIFFSLIILNGCATKEAVKNVSDEGLLRDKVNAYWNYRVEKNLTKSYEYELPAERLELNNYVRRYSNPMIEYKSFDVKSISMKDGVADVELALSPVVKAPGARPFEHTIIITDRWVKMNDEWYHALKSVNKVTHKKEEGGDTKD